MSQILLISGSPSVPSKSGFLLDHAQKTLESLGLSTALVSVRDFPAEDLIHARYDSPSFAGFIAQVAEAEAIVIATPIYKAAYTGSLKALLDILPQAALKGKTILPIASGGSMAHLLAIDYSIKPVLSVLGASAIQQGVYVVDAQFQKTSEGLVLDPEILGRFDAALHHLADALGTLSV